MLDLSPRGPPDLHDLHREARFLEDLADGEVKLVENPHGDVRICMPEEGASEIDPCLQRSTGNCEPVSKSCQSSVGKVHEERMDVPGIRTKRSQSA